MSKELRVKTLSRLQAEMRADGLDACFLFKNETTRYITGYQNYFSATFVPYVNVTIVLQDRKPILLLPVHKVPTGAHLDLEECLPLPLETRDRGKSIADVLARHGLRSGRVAIESDYLPSLDMDVFRSALPKFEWVDITPTIERCTTVKFPEEIICIKEAARIADVAMEAIFETAKVGVTEKQLAAAATIAAMKAGAEVVNHVNIRSGDNARIVSSVPSTRELQLADPLQCDIGFIFDGYLSDINRTKYIGKCPDYAADVIKAVVGCQRKLLESIRPGVAISSLYNDAKKQLSAAGYGDDFNMRFIGHSIGISLHETPLIHEEATQTLRENMVLCVEPGLFAKSGGTCRMEDMVLVTSGGFENLTKIADDMSLNNV